LQFCWLCPELPAGCADCLTPERCTPGALFMSVIIGTVAALINSTSSKPPAQPGLQGQGHLPGRLLLLLLLLL